MCGLSKHDLEKLNQLNISKIVHIAGLVKFDEALSKDIWRVNYDGTQNVLELGEAINAKDFHYISTAYVYGELRNPYESSKHEAEKLVTNSRFPHSIYRIGIVVGDSKTGHTDGYDGYYGFFAGLHSAAQMLRQKYNVNGEVDLPINLVCSKESTLNLVPVDWLIDNMTLLIEKEPTNQTYFLVNPNPPLVSDVMANGLKTLGIRNYKLVAPDSLPIVAKCKDRLVAIIQKSITKILKRYEPYVTHEDKFPVEKTIEDAELNIFSTFPPVNNALMEKYLHYALASNFGRNI